MEAAKQQGAFDFGTEESKYKTPDGSAPAVGWIVNLEAVEGEGLWATVDWTEQGAEYVSSKAYRYLSPVFLVPKGSDRPAILHSIALTNKPAIVGTRPIVNREVPMSSHNPLTSRTAETMARALGLFVTVERATLIAELESFIAELRSMEGPVEDRDAVINRAAAEYDAEPTLQAVRNKAGYVADELRQAGRSDELTATSRGA